MASEDDHPIFPDDDLDDDDNSSTSSPLNDTAPDENENDAVMASYSSSSDTDDVIPDITTTLPSATVTVAIPSSVAAPTNAVTVALPDPKRPRFDSSPTVTEKRPIDDSRRLFQRLWTDEDEIELLQGFLDYTTSRGTTSSGHHHDTAAFYDQIKNKLQLEFNKNQLVEKLRRLKKKYRNVLSKMSSGKEFVFKSPHDQATFELSRKIWTNLSGGFRAAAAVVEFDDDNDHCPNPNPNSVTIAAATPPRPPNSSYVISHINLNNAAAAAAAASPVGGSGSGGNNMSNFDMMMSNFGSGGGGGLAKLSSRKRPRVGKVEEKVVKTEGVNMNVSSNNNAVNNNNISSNANNNSNVQMSSPLQGLVEETVRSCLSPVVKELVNNAVNGAAVLGGCSGSGGVGGFKGVSALAMNAVPLNFSGVMNSGSNGEGNNGMDEKWRRQQILELEVYSKRLELVQDQIKLSLEELRSMGS